MKLKEAISSRKQRLTQAGWIVVDPTNMRFAQGGPYQITTLFSSAYVFNADQIEKGTAAATRDLLNEYESEKGRIDDWRDKREAGLWEIRKVRLTAEF